MCSMSRSTHPAIFEVNPITHFGVISLFSSNFQILILFVLYFKNYKRQMVSWNCKHVQHVKIYLPCNFEVNPITHFGVIALFSSFFFFSSPGHRPGELLSWVSVRRPSVSFTHVNLLLWNRWTDFNQTCQKCSLDGPLPDLCFWCWFEIQHGCQGP